jgi:hypothetical protein
VQALELMFVTTIASPTLPNATPRDTMLTSICVS